MPGAPAEIVGIVNDLLALRVTGLQLDNILWADGTYVTEPESRDILALYDYAVRRMRKSIPDPAQRKARRLLRSLLTPGQRATLSRLGYFYVTAPSGTAYRLDPRRGRAERVDRHKGRYFAKRSYCLHDAQDAGKMPPADVTIAHMLLLMADESAFLATANETRTDDQLWNREYLARMRNRHDCRQVPADRPSSRQPPPDPLLAPLEQPGA